jgi:hypothetical protein
MRTADEVRERKAEVVAFIKDQKYCGAALTEADEELMALDVELELLEIGGRGVGN